MKLNISRFLLQCLILALDISFTIAFWVSDGSSELKISGNIVTSTAGSGGDVYNAMWKEGAGISSGEHYWKIKLTKVDDGGAFVGLTNRNYFAKGYSSRGIFYGGNLSNGLSLLVDKFGPNLKGGDTVGILASVSDGKLKVYFDHNGSPLGLAFNINYNILPNFYPTVQFYHSGSATITKESKIPPPGARNPVSTTFTGIEGNWKISSPKNMKLHGKAFELEKQDPLATMTLKPLGGNSFNVNLNIINRIEFNVEQKGNTWKSTTTGSSTYIGGSPKWMELEGVLYDLAQNPDSVTVSKNQLILKSSIAQATFHRYDSKRTYSENPFD